MAPMKPPLLASILVAVATSLPVTSSVAAQDASKGAALLAQARDALGGEDRLRAVKALDVRGEFKRMVGQNTIEGMLQVRLQLPDKLRRDEDLSPPGGGPSIVRTEVLNGAEVWDENSGGGGFIIRGFGPGAGRGGGRGSGGGDVQGRGRGALDPAQLAEVQRRGRQADLARLMLAWLLAADGPAIWIGAAESPDGRADVVEITPANVPAIRLFLDESSHVPLMMTWQAPAVRLFTAGRGGRGPDGDAGGPPPDRPPQAQSAQQATFRMTLGEYKTVGGIRLPHLITRGMNGQTIEEWTIDSYRINPSLREDVFKK